MREFIIKFDTDKPLSELASGTNLRAMMKVTGNCDEIIRCKDCKYWLPHSQFGFDEDNEEYHDYCERLVPEDDYYAFTRDADDFCSRAKRKEG